jgi:hypothetical protein
MSKAQAIVLVLALLMFLPAFAAMIRAAGPGLAPVASFTYSPDVPGPQDVIVFNASSSYSPSGWIVQYSWDFGDGNTATVTDPSITHAYYVDGDYTVQLTVTDNNGYTNSAVAVIPIRCVVFFRVVILGTTTPVANLKVTAYYYNGSAWVKAPASNKGIEIKYDNMTQPNLANTNAQRYRNPGYTASILRASASNIGFEIHSIMTDKVFFKVEWGSWVAYWPNNTTRVYTYEAQHGGEIDAHDYHAGHQAYWDPAASAYVIKAEDIAGAGVSPTENHPILFSIYCPPPTPTYYLTVKTAPQNITTIPGEGFYIANTNVTLTAPTYVNVSTTTRYRFDYWDVDGTSRGSGVNPTTVFMNANHTATAHYVTQYAATFSQTGLSADATGTIVTVNGNPETYTQLPFTLWADCGSSVTYSYGSIVSSSVSGKQFKLSGITGPSSPITVTGSSTITGSYVVQYRLVFAQTGLDSSASGTVVTANGNPKVYADFPYTLWVDSGTSVTYSYSSTVSSSVSGKRFRLDTVTGSASPITVTGPNNLTGNYKTQYYFTITSPYDSPSPSSGWFDSGSGITEFVTSPVSGGSGVQYVCTGWTGTGSVPASGTASSVAFTITAASSITWSWKTQYQVTFDQAGVGSDFTGTVVSIDSVNYAVGGLSVSFWWDGSSSHSFSFASPLIVGSEQYSWSSTSGLSTLQSGTLIVTASGSVVGDYVIQNQITFDHVGVSSDFTGTVVTIDSINYSLAQLPASFLWTMGSTHSFAFQSPLAVGVNAKQYVWTSTTGLSSQQSGSITVSTYGSIIGNYKTQYTVTFDRSGLDSSASGTVATVNGNPLTYGQLPYAIWADSSASITYYYNNVSSSTTGKQFILIGVTGLPSPIAVTGTMTVTGNYQTQYQVTFSQTGVGSDFTGTVVIIDSNAYTLSSLPVSFWWDSSSSHLFAFSSPLIVNASTQYNWASTSGLATLQNGSLSVTGPGSVTGNYATETKLQVTFSQNGLNLDFTGTVISVDGTNYKVGDLPAPFWWDIGSVHTFAYQSPLVVSPNGKQYVWTSTTGLSTLQSDSITVSTSGGVTGNYKTQYYLTLSSDPQGVASPSGAGWYDAGTNASINTVAFIDIVPGCSRYRFNGWTTTDMTEIQDPSRSPTTVVMDQGKTVTAEYAVQCRITFSQAGIGPDYPGIIITIDGWDYNLIGLPASFMFDNGSIHTFSFASPLVVDASKQYVWVYTLGLSTLQADSLTVSNCGNVTGNYATGVTYTLTITATAGGMTNPAVGAHIYPGGSTVQVTAIPNANYQFDHWELDSSNVGAANPYSVLMGMDHTLNAVFKPTPAPNLSVSITPRSATIHIGESLTFNSIVIGGVQPYSYQWYLDGTLVTGATASSWTWTPQHASLHHVYVKVTDTNGATAQSDPASITVTSLPIGGYSVSLTRPSMLASMVAYIAVVALSSAALSARKRKRK